MWFYIIIALMLLFLVIESIIERIKHIKNVKKRNEEYRQVHGNKKRGRCIDCHYCRWRYYHPFPDKKSKYYCLMVTKQPLYCKKFKVQLEHDSLLTCVSELDSNAFWGENTTEKRI